jgi:hypothetical protein
VIEHLPSKHEALNSNHKHARKKNERNPKKLIKIHFSGPRDILEYYSLEAKAGPHVPFLV